ncbi:tripartite motif-containing protein 16-like [Halichoeres trimaculatus]|uniref:tripartite motif-containing protein 16-like n=1 Tax=Halichoeres trimaculatus TaxID=147232 RepID=UPI003D9EFCC9
MAQQGLELNPEAISCVICVDFLKDPVTIPCGHSYCMTCINTHWDTEGEQNPLSCPQCRQTFTLRPALVKNIMLAALVEKLKKSGNLQDAPADHCYAGPEDVACDVCSGRKLKALKSCLQCLASFCKQHLQPHFESITFEKHKLVNPSKRLRENICTLHDEVKKLFCRTDQQLICYLCSVDGHQGHSTVSAAAERSERQVELEVSGQKIQQKIQQSENDIKALQRGIEALNYSADEAVVESEKICNELIQLIKERQLNTRMQVRSQQKTEVGRVKEFEETLDQEITELKRKDAELEKLSHTEDHNQFLHDYPSVYRLPHPRHMSDINFCPLKGFELKSTASEVCEKVQDIMSEKWTLRDTEVEVSLSSTPPKTRAESLKYACDISLDPNTVNKQLILSDDNKRVTCVTQSQKYSNHPERFDARSQVLSKEGLTGRCYWEVRRGEGRAYIAVSYKNIPRAGSSDECIFGFNDKSWALRCENNGYTFLQNGVHTPVSGPLTPKVGVYLDHAAGILSFYSISETITLLHTVQTTFTLPLHAGFWLIHCYGNFAEICKLT